MTTMEQMARDLVKEIYNEIKDWVSLYVDIDECEDYECDLLIEFSKELLTTKLRSQNETINAFGNNSKESKELVFKNHALIDEIEDIIRL